MNVSGVSSLAQKAPSRTAAPLPLARVIFHIVCASCHSYFALMWKFKLVRNTLPFQFHFIFSKTDKIQNAGRYYNIIPVSANIRKLIPFKLAWIQ